MDFRKIDRTIIACGIVVIIISIIPGIIYFLHFKDASISDNPANWGVFGDFIAGTSGALLGFFAVLFSLISIYFTARIAEQIQKNEFSFNELHSEKNREMLLLQNKPYPYLDLSRYDQEIRVVIQNMGLGPLIITHWKILYLKEEFPNFNKLLLSKLSNTHSSAEIKFNSASTYVLAPNANKEILLVRPLSVQTEHFLSIQNEVRKLLADSEIIIDYEDIFANKFTHSKKLTFFK